MEENEDQKDLSGCDLSGSVFDAPVFDSPVFDSPVFDAPTIEVSDIDFIELPIVKRYTRRATDAPRKSKIRPSRRARSPPPIQRHKTPRKLRKNKDSC